ncbi:MAG: NAD(P)/FAD-dependent oxidoreductase, partial [Pseudomonadota bacterium]
LADPQLNGRLLIRSSQNIYNQSLLASLIAHYFKPTYEPWDQRFCAVPDADLFKAIKCGDASIETDTIKTFTENGLLLGSGQHLDADLVVKATGLKLLPLGGIKMYLNGDLVDFKETFIYKGFMCSAVPNFFALFGYTNASWTLKTDLAMRYVCRLLERMQRRDADMVLPEMRGASPQPEPIIGLQSGYVSRGIDLFPRQGHRRPWRNHQSYIADYLDMRFGSLEDGVMQFKRKQRRPLLQEVAE